MQLRLKASGAAGAPRRWCSTSATLFGRMAKSFHGTPHGVNIVHVDDEMTNGVNCSLSHIEAKYRVLLFKQLTAYVEKIYGMIRDNLKKEISPLLGLCIQARTSRVSSLTVGTAAGQQSLFAHWKGIDQSFSNYLSLMKANNASFSTFLLPKEIYKFHCLCVAFYECLYLEFVYRPHNF